MGAFSPTKKAKSNEYLPTLGTTPRLFRKNLIVHIEEKE
jgi:hypothetical protein